jgi:hypothetical protein
MNCPCGKGDWKDEQNVTFSLNSIANGCEGVSPALDVLAHCHECEQGFYGMLPLNEFHRTE